MKEKAELIVPPMPLYDIDVISRSLGLIPVEIDVEYAFWINPAAIVSIEFESPDDFTIRLHGGESHVIGGKQMSELQATIRHREDEAKEQRKETFKENIMVQQQAIDELNNRVQPGMLVGVPGGKKGRQ